MQKSKSHMHARSYFGELDAELVVKWLNSTRRPMNDPLETLVKLNARLPVRATQHEAADYIAKLVRRSKIAVAPVLIPSAENRWRIDWRLVGNMDPSQGLALIKLLQLADRGLLGRIRKCGDEDCGRWFYARFEHQRFHSTRCQQETFRSDPNWKARRRTYMKELRQEKKLRERRWLRAAKGKGKR